jgi:hypothetical protein
MDTQLTILNYTLEWRSSPFKNYTHTLWVLLGCCPSPVLWYRLPVADVPLPGFPNCARPIATANIDSQCTHLTSILNLSPTILFEVLSKNWLLLGSFRFTFQPTVRRLVRLDVGSFFGYHDQSQPVCRGVDPNLGLVTRYYFLSEGCLRGAPSLTRGRVCHLSYIYRLSLFYALMLNWWCR